MIDPVSLLLLLILALVAGSITGLSPGLNPVTGLIMIMPMMIFFDPYEIVIFWAAFICVTQYYGSVSALLFKVPGETSSLPVLKHSAGLESLRSVLKTYRITAVSSYVSALVALALFSTIIWSLKNSWHVFFGTTWNVIFLSLILLILIFMNRNWAFNAVLVATGLIIANIGKVPTVQYLCGQQEWICFALKPTDLNLAILCLYAVPFFFINADHFNARRDDGAAMPGWALAMKYRWISIKHSLLGFVMGFVPGMGVTLSSNVSATLESLTKKPRPLRVMAASESANNSSIISGMTPFLLLGIPITGTELILDSWFLVNKATVINAEFFYADVTIANYAMAFPALLIICLLLINTASFWATSSYARFYLLIGRIPPGVFGWMIKILLAVSLVISISWASLGTISTVFTLTFFTLLGIYAARRRRDVIALPVALMIGSMLVDKFISAYYIWS